MSKELILVPLKEFDHIFYHSNYTRHADDQCATDFQDKNIPTLDLELETTQMNRNFLEQI